MFGDDWSVRRCTFMYLSPLAESLNLPLELGPCHYNATTGDTELNPFRLVFLCQLLREADTINMQLE
jgi:hypothetical protein